MTAAPSRLLTLRPKDIEREYGIPVQTQANWRANGRGPAFIRISPRMIFVERAAIEKWLASRRVESER